MNRLVWALGCVALITASIGPAAAEDDQEQHTEAAVLGYLEHVRVGTLGLEMTAKLDTGADTSSVHARNVEIYKRGERDHWVKFRLVGKDGRSVRYDQNVIRFVQIKTKNGGTIRRPVIRLPLCVGGMLGAAEVNLADRDNFEYDILIGREFLSNRVLVDSGRSFVSEETCENINED